MAFHFISMKLLRQAGLLTTLALLGGACHKNETAVAVGNREQILHIGNLVEPIDMDPQIATDQQTFNVVQAYFRR